MATGNGGAVNWKTGKVFPRFYDKIGLSILGKRDAPRIKTFKMGYGFVDTGLTPPGLLALPDTENDIPDVFFSDSPVMEYGDRRILVACRLPQGALAESKHYNLTGLFDDEGDLVAVTQDLPVWISPSDRYTVYTYIDFPNVGDNPPEAFGGVK